MVAARGEDLRFDLRLDFRRAIWGGEETIRIQHLETCQACDGRGEQRQGLGNWFRGEPSAVCNACSGNGRTEVLKDLTVTIPPGVEEGTRLRVYEEGDAGERGGEPGDLYLFLSVGEDSEFKRDGTSLLSEISIKQEEAASGCQVQVKTIDGTIETLTIPPGIQPNTVLTL
ncbi:MAG TPA: DnaJ C-terminal domain-containing protein, partial [Trichocoleus sp.]